MFFGLTISSISLLLGTYWFFEFIFYRPEIEKGIPLIIISLFFFSGIQTFLIGLLGEYLVSIHKQVKRKENLIEKERINF